MVDVGYFINGKHGILHNVKVYSKEDKMIWFCGHCEEGGFYQFKTEYIEYIIPHEEPNVEEKSSGKIVFDKDGVTEYDEDGSVVMNGRYVENKNLLPPKPMTFAEKFKEVFGYEPDKYATPCDIVNCKSKESCQGCPYDNFDWDDPYVKAED